MSLEEKIEVILVGVGAMHNLGNLLHTPNSIFQEKHNELYSRAPRPRRG